jgi:transcriptional regulator with GAF, ATPase, and Fis domain
MDELPVALNGQKVESFQRSLLMEALEASGHNPKTAADKLSMSYDQFRHYFKKLINTL